MSAFLDLVKREPARVRAAILALLIGVSDQLDDFLGAIGVEDGVWGLDLDWFVRNEAQLDKALSFLGIVVLVAFGRASIREVVTPIDLIEDRSATEPIWRRDGGE